MPAFDPINRHKQGDLGKDEKVGYDNRDTSFGKINMGPDNALIKSVPSRTPPQTTKVFDGLASANRPHIAPAPKGKVEGTIY